jgi:hypothetical protein
MQHVWEVLEEMRLYLGGDREPGKSYGKCGMLLELSLGSTG